MEYKIKPPSDRAFGEARTYFTEYDPVVQYWYYQDGSQRLLDKLKTLSILHDSITVAASHIVRSDVTFDHLSNNRRLLEEGIVIPAMNSDFDSFVDMVDRKLKSDIYATPWLPGNQSISESALMERAKYLDKHTGRVMGWDIDRMRGDFRTGILRDLEDSTSKLHYDVSGSVDVQKLYNRLEGLEPFSREQILDSCQYLPNDVQVAISNQMNLHYHLTGASVHQAAPNLHSREIEVFGDSLERSIDFDSLDESLIEQISENSDRIGGQISRDQAFQEFTDIIGVRSDLISRLTDDELIALRNIPLARDFRDQLVDVLDNVNRKAEAEQIRDLHELREELQIEIQNRYESQRRSTNRIKRGITVTAWASGIGALLLGAQDVGQTLTVMSPLVHYMMQDLPAMLGNEFLALGEVYETLDNREY